MTSSKNSSHWHDIPRAQMVDLVKFGNAQRPGVTGAVDDVRDIPQSSVQALRVADGADARFYPRQAGFDEASVAGGAQERHCGDSASTKAVRNVAADEAGCACK